MSPNQNIPTVDPDGRIWEDLLPPRLAPGQLAASFEARASRTGATVGQVPTLQADGTLVLRTPAAVDTTPLTAAVGALYAGLASRVNLPCRLVFTGSSTTAGRNASTASKRYINLLTTRLQQLYPSDSAETTPVYSDSATFGTLSSTRGVHSYSAGQSGTTAVTYLTDAECDRILALAPRAVFHMVGSNDYGTGVTPAAYKDTLTARIAYLKAGTPANRPCVHILIHAYQRFDAITPVAPWAEYGAALAQIARADPDNVAAIDISNPYRLVGIPGTDPLGLIDGDDIHQTDAGHALMADLIFQALKLPAALGAAAGPDTTAPTVAITAPAAGSTVTGTTTVSGTASDNVGVTSVQVLAGAVSLGSATITGGTWSLTWNTTGTTDGTVSLTAVAGDAAANTATSAAVTVTVASTNPPPADTTAPSTPSKPTATAGDSTVALSNYGTSTDNVGVSGYRIYRNGSSTPLNTSALAGTTYTDATAVNGTAYTYTAAAVDAAGNLSALSPASDAVTPAAVTGGTTLASDGFERADTTAGLGTADTGQTWSGDATWQIANGYAQPPSTAASSQLLNIGAADADTYADVVWQNSTAGVIFRAKSTSDRLAANAVTNTNELRIYKNTTILVSGAYSPGFTTGQTYRIRVVAKGDQVRCYVNTTLVLSFTLSASDQSTYGSATLWGMRFSSGTIARYGEFRAVTAPATL